MGKRNIQELQEQIKTMGISEEKVVLVKRIEEGYMFFSYDMEFADRLDYRRGSVYGDRK